MALSMDEQRVLAEIERRLTSEDPGLAACMTNFRRPGPAAVLRSPRGRIVGSLFTVLLVAMISLMVYAMIPFRGHTTRSPANNPQISAPGTANHNEITASSGGKITTSTAASAATANRTAASKAGASTKPGATAHNAKPQTTTQSHPDQARANSAGS